MIFFILKQRFLLTFKRTCVFFPSCKRAGTKTALLSLLLFACQPTFAVTNPLPGCRGPLVALAPDGGGGWFSGWFGGRSTNEQDPLAQIALPRCGDIGVNSPTVLEAVRRLAQTTDPNQIEEIAPGLIRLNDYARYHLLIRGDEASALITEVGNAMSSISRHLSNLAQGGPSAEIRRRATEVLQRLPTLHTQRGIEWLLEPIHSIVSATPVRDRLAALQRLERWAVNEHDDVAAMYFWRHQENLTQLMDAMKAKHDEKEKQDREFQRTHPNTVFNYSGYERFPLRILVAIRHSPWISPQDRAEAQQMVQQTMITVESVAFQRETEQVRHLGTSERNQRVLDLVSNARRDLNSNTRQSLPQFNGSLDFATSQSFRQAAATLTSHAQSWVVQFPREFEARVRELTILRREMVQGTTVINNHVRISISAVAVIRLKMELKRIQSHPDVTANQDAMAAIRGSLQAIDAASVPVSVPQARAIIEIFKQIPEWANATQEILQKLNSSDPIRVVDAQNELTFRIWQLESFEASLTDPVQQAGVREILNQVNVARGQ